MSVSSLVESALLVERDLYIHATPDALSDGLQATCNGLGVALEAVSEMEFHPPNAPFRGAFLFAPDGVELTEQLADGTVLDSETDAFVNALPDWSLENGVTLQMRIEEVHQPRVIGIETAVSVSAGDAPATFEALIASHRCQAALLIRFENDATGEVVVKEVPLDPSYTGGRLGESYQLISVPSPLGDAACTVTLQIDYLGYRPDSDEVDSPFVFLANPRMIGAMAARAQQVPRHVTPGEAVGGAWYHARVPGFRTADDAPIQLMAGDETIDLFAPDANAVTLIDDHGHMIVVQARSPQSMLLYVNGSVAQRVNVESSHTAIRIPSKFLRGEIIDVSLRDLSGSQEFLSIPVLAPRLVTPHDVMARESRAPFPTDLTVRANHRYQALRAHLKDPVEGMDAASLATAVETLDRTHDTLKLRPISFPDVENPTVSVIVPAHNKVNVTYYGLCALLLAHNRTSFEVIVVDDASTDETAELETLVSGIRVIHNSQAQRFIRACNAGVAEARGEYIVLLNNDTEPTVGWLDALVDAFTRFDDVGLAGSKLLYPDGTLQDAGGIIWGSGNPWNYGNGANPWDPRFCYTRQADYLSGAAMMTTKALWEHLGGLSSYLEPMYFEDTDFAFKVREAGYKTYFVPSSVVYHFEGMTSGTDSTSGFKRYQEVNRPKFKRRWARDFARFGKEGQDADLEKDRGISGRVLFIDHSGPREDRDAGSYAARREIELVQSLGHKVTFLPQNLAHLGSYTNDLEANGVEMIHAPFFLSLSEFIEARGAEFDAVYITRYSVAQQALPLIREHAPEAKVILNNADLHFLRELRAALSTGDPNRMAAMRSVREQELEMMTQADLVLSYNEVEHSVIASHTDGAARVMTCPWVVEIPSRVPPLKGRAGLSFLGNYGHPPNAEGITWFCKEVMPLLDGTGARLSIYGSGMGDDIKDLASDMIDPVGFVDDISDAYDRHRVFVGPLLSGAGIKGKVLSALAHGIPAVLTPVAAEGIGLRNGHDCLIVETPQDWASAILTLLEDDKLWTAMSDAARSYAADSFSFAAGRDKMKAAFEAVDLFGAV